LIVAGNSVCKQDTRYSTGNGKKLTLKMPNSRFPANPSVVNRLIMGKARACGQLVTAVKWTELSMKERQFGSYRWGFVERVRNATLAGGSAPTSNK
jgi:hypothetical protein